MLRTTDLPTGILREELIDAIIVSIPEEVKTLDTEKATEYRNVTCSYQLPNGTKRNAIAKMWEASLNAHSDKFVVGAEVTLAVQTEGQFRGHAKVELPSMLVDLDAMFGTAPATASEPVATKEPVATAL